MKDEGHTRLAWPPHSYENINFIKEHYESMPVSSQMVEETRPISTLHHKVLFPYESDEGLHLGGDTVGGEGVGGGLARSRA